jgi:hypothetical protein
LKKNERIVNPWIHAELDETPDNWALRFLLAEWLEEHGNGADADCQRWMLKCQKCPEPGRPMRENAFWDNWHWWGMGVEPHDIPGMQALLPEELHAAIRRHGWMYSTREKAEKALADALSQTDSEAERAGPELRPPHKSH